MLVWAQTIYSHRAQILTEHSHQNKVFLFNFYSVLYNPP